MVTGPRSLAIVGITHARHAAGRPARRPGGGRSAPSPLPALRSRSQLLTSGRTAPIVARIRQLHLKQLAHAAAALPGPKLDIPLWASLRALDLAPRSAADESGGTPAATIPPDLQREIAALRALVAACLQRLGARMEDKLSAALAEARRAWDQADSVTIVDAELGRMLADARRKLAAAAGAGADRRPLAAVGLEGLIALEAACGLTTLAERRLSSVIRLRLRGQDEDLLPGGRPFLDLGAAFSEAARAWA
jgi:hypothetical protein